MSTIKYLKCIAVDDEQLAIDKIVYFIKKVPYLQLEATFTNSIEALNYLKNNSVDLLFLDIQMDDINGLQLIELLKDKPHIILTTAYSEYAIKSYELEVSDYLLKPISFERFLQSVNRVSDKINNRESVLSNSENSKSEIPNRSDFILVKTDYQMQKVAFNEILFVEGMKDYLRIVMPNKRIMTLQTFKNMLSTLPENQFCRIHKSYIISIDKIKAIERNHVIINNERIPIGESYKNDFFDKLKDLGILPTDYKS
jgi:two-component system LytT family response regulator